MFFISLHILFLLNRFRVGVGSFNRNNYFMQHAYFMDCVSKTGFNRDIDMENGWDYQS